MGQKINPISLRLPVNKEWKSRWFSSKNYKSFLQEDLKIRSFLQKKFKGMGVERVSIERSPNAVSIIIGTSRPGLLIGKGGSSIEEIKKILSRMTKSKANMRIDIQEVKNPEASAPIMAESMAEQLEKRMSYRRLMKMTLSKIMASKGVKGVKIALSGRLDGNEIARAEHMEQGSLPLQTLRANIDYARATAHTTYGTIGVKVWIFKGLNF